MNPKIRDVRPEQGVIVKGDSAYSARLATPTVAVAFRVHYGVEADPSDHRVTDLLWEDEACTFSRAVAAFPGMRLIASESRPDGIEAVQGWARPPAPRNPFPDPRPSTLARASDLGWMVRDAYLCQDPDYVQRMTTDLLAFVSTIRDADLKAEAIRYAMNQYWDVAPRTV